MGSTPRCRVLRWRVVARPGLVMAIGLSLSSFTRDVAGVLGHAHHPDLLDWILPTVFPAHNENTAVTLTYLPCFLIAAIWTNRSTVSITTFGLRLESWGRATTVPWAAVESVRIAATGHAAELTVRIGAGHLRHPPGHLLTRRVGRADLADLDAMLRAYAPPHALAARTP